MRLGLRDAMLLSCVALATAAIFTWSLAPGDWSVPMQFSGDALFYEAGFATCSTSLTGCLTGAEPRLGAPFGSSWADFPRTEELWWAVAGLLARAGGLGWATNVLFLAAAVGAAIVMYLAARRLRAHPALAGAVALIYGLTPFLYTRNQNHFIVTLYLFLPVGVLVWRALAQPGRRLHRAALVAGSLVMGAQAVYFASYFVFGVVLCGAWQASKRRWRMVRWCAASAGLAVAVMFVMSLDTFALVARDGLNRSAVVRRAADATYNALWPEQLFIPSEFHRVAAVRELVAPYAARADSRGEYPSAYLGLAGCAALLALLATGARRWRARGPALRNVGLVAFWLAMALPFGALAQVGRLTGTPLLRSNNRVSMVLLTVALLWLAHRLSRLTARKRGFSWAVGAALAVLGVAEQVPLTEPDVDPQHRARVRDEWRATRELVARLEARPGPVRLFVWPPGEFPEDGHPPFGDPYLPFQLFVHSTRAEWSFGGIRGRRAGDWPREVAALGPAAFRDALRSQGFTGLVTRPGHCDAACVEALGPSELTRVDGTAWVALTWP